MIAIHQLDDGAPDSAKLNTNQVGYSLTSFLRRHCGKIEQPMHNTFCVPHSSLKKSTAASCIFHGKHESRAVVSRAE